MIMHRGWMSALRIFLGGIAFPGFCVLVSLALVTPDEQAGHIVLSWLAMFVAGVVCAKSG